MKFLKNKILLFTFLFTLFFLLSFSNSIFATEDINIPDIPDNKPYIITYNNNTKEIVELAYPVLTGSDYKFYLIDRNNYKEISYSCDGSSGLWYFASFNNSNNSFGSFRKSIYNSLSLENFDRSIYNSTINVYTDSSLETVFFYPTAIIPTLKQVEEIPKAITATLQIMIPVGLVVLGIGLIIYLIKRVIYSVQ